MNETNYEKVRVWILEKDYRFKIFKILYNLLPVLVFLTYGIMIALLAVNRDTRLIKFMLIPAFLFVTISFLRKVINSPRPYTVMNVKPLIEKKKTGESFPSRHMLSVSVIAAACFSIHNAIGIAMCVIGVLIGIIRVAAGVHFIKDVVWGALIGFFGGILLFIFL